MRKKYKPGIKITYFFALIGVIGLFENLYRLYKPKALPSKPTEMKWIIVMIIGSIFWFWSTRYYIETKTARKIIYFLIINILIGAAYNLSLLYSLHAVSLTFSLLVIVVNLLFLYSCYAHLKFLRTSESN